MNWRALLVTVAAAALTLGLKAQTPWTQESSPTAEDLHGVCWSAGKFVAVGAGGAILSSPDGVNWTSESSGTSVDLYAVGNAGAQFVAVGDQGTILTSPDGVAWTTRHLGGPLLDAVSGAANPSWYVAVGQGGAVLTSTDGVTWATQAVGTTANLNAIAVSSGLQAIAAGDNGTLVTWTSAGPAVSNIGSGSNLFGVTSIATDAATAEMAVGTNGFCAIQSGDAWNSISTGVSAQLNAAVQPLVTPDGFAAQGVIVGNEGLALVATTPDTPQDLTRWRSAPTGTTSDLLGVAVGYTTIVAVGRAGTILTALGGLYGPELGTPSFPPDPITVGASFTLGTSALSSGPVTYQWSYNGEPISGATSPTLSLTDIQFNQSGTYTEVVDNGYMSSSDEFNVDVGFVGTTPGLVDPAFQYAGMAFLGTPLALLPDGDLIDFGQWIHANGALGPNLELSLSVVPGYYVVQSDGRPVAVGELDVGATPGSQRFNTDGTVDSTWNPDQAQLPNGAGSEDDADPTIALASGDFLSISPSGLVVRVLPTGQRDTAYVPMQESATGLQPATFSFTPGVYPTAVASATDSTMGWVWVVSSLNPRNIYRFLADGTPDPSFSVATASSPVTALHAQNGKLEYYGISGGTFSAGRMNGDGSIDSDYTPIAFASQWILAVAFAPDGSLYLDYSEGYPPRPFSLPPTPPSDVPWWIGDSTFPAKNYPAPSQFRSTYREGIVRFDPNGNFDPSFSLNLDGGWPVVGATADADIGQMVFTPAGQLYVVGNFTAIQGVAASGIARLNISAGAAIPILVNLSALGSVGPGSQDLAGGFVIGNAGSKAMLLRADGPALTSLGVPNQLPDPELTLFGANGQELATATDWSQSPSAGAIASAATRVGAFALPLNSADAAVLLNLPAGMETLSVTGASNETGMALMEIYDADVPPLTYASPQLINASVRGEVTPGKPLVGGFVIGQGNLKRVLVRAIGPSLAQFGVAGVLPDPVLSLYKGSDQIASEQGWGTWQALLEPTFEAVGAFSLQANSADSAIVLALPPGAYSVQVTSASGVSGQAMAEIYAVP